MSNLRCRLNQEGPILEAGSALLDLLIRSNVRCIDSLDIKFQMLTITFLWLENERRMEQISNDYLSNTALLSLSLASCSSLDGYSRNLRTPCFQAV